MDYVFCRINEAADRVDAFRREVELAPYEYTDAPEGRGLEVDKELYGDKPEYASHEALIEGVKKRLWDAYVTLRKAAIYAQRVEWWQSCDDGSLSFIGRLDEELAELEKELEQSQ